MKKFIFTFVACVSFSTFVNAADKAEKTPDRKPQQVGYQDSFICERGSGGKKESYRIVYPSYAKGKIATPVVLTPTTDSSMENLAVDSTYIDGNGNIVLDRTQIGEQGDGFNPTFLIANLKREPAKTGGTVRLIDSKKTVTVDLKCQ